MRMRTGAPGRRGFGRSEDGATAIEFAFVAPMLIALFIATIQIGVLELMSANLDAAVPPLRFDVGDGDVAA